MSIMWKSLKLQHRIFVFCCLKLIFFCWRILQSPGYLIILYILTTNCMYRKEQEILLNREQSACLSKSCFGQLSAGLISWGSKETVSVIRLIKVAQRSYQLHLSDGFVLIKLDQITDSCPLMHFCPYPAVSC